MNNRAKKILLLVLVIGLLGMTIAYAQLSQNLNISGAASVKGATWDIYIDNFTGPSYHATNYYADGEGITATSAASVIKTPTVKTTSITGLEVQFTKPGTSVEYNFDLVNAGTVDAYLDRLDIAGRTGTGAFTCTGTASDPQQAQADADLVCSHLTYDIVDLVMYNHIDNMTLNKATVSGNTLTPTRYSCRLFLTLEDMNTLPSADVTVSGLDINFLFIQK